MGYIWRIVIVSLIIWLLYRLIYNWLRKPEKTDSSTAAADSLQEMVQDPQCQMYLPRNQALELKIAGQTYYFCSKACKDNFLDSYK